MRTPREKRKSSQEIKLASVGPDDFDSVVVSGLELENTPDGGL